MSFNSAMLEQMKAEGLDLDACIRIVKAGEKKADPSNAQRQARHRERRKGAKAESNGVTVTGVTGFPNDKDILTLPPSLEISNEITPPIPEIEETVEPEHVVEAWNAMAETCGLPKAKLTANRRPKLRTFVRRNTVDDITEAIWKIPQSDFLCGRNDRAWKADLDFFVNPSKFPKILEGSYG